MDRNTTSASNQAHMQETLTEWYESQIAEGNKPSWQDFKAVNEASHEPLEGEAALALFTELSRERNLGSMGRTLLGKALREGVPEPEELERDILLKGKSHQIFTGPGNGKTWVALYLVKRAIKRKERVMFFDMENGQRTITERLQDLGVGKHVDKYLFYYDFPELGMESYYASVYRTELDTIDPALVVFDSWVGCLVTCGLDENSNTDVEAWANAYVLPAKSRDCTVVMLDHVPHEAKRSRGATRKKDLVDVQWRLDKIQDFDRTRVGYVQLTREKDREGWLPLRVGFSVGGTPEGFVMERSEGTVDDDPGDGLTGNARAAFDALNTFGDAGAGYEAWRKSIPWKEKPEMPDSTFRTARDRLMTLKLIRHEGDRYYTRSEPHNTDWWNEDPPF